MEQGFILNDIEEMDFFLYLRVLIYKINKEDKSNNSYIEEIF